MACNRAAVICPLAIGVPAEVKNPWDFQSVPTA